MRARTIKASASNACYQGKFRDVLPEGMPNPEDIPGISVPTKTPLLSKRREKVDKVLHIKSYFADYF